MTRIEAVLSFCERSQEGYYYFFDRPWLSGDKVLATDGKFMIIVPAPLIPGHAFMHWDPADRKGKDEPDPLRAYSLPDVPPEPFDLSVFRNAMMSCIDGEPHKQVLYRTVPETEPCAECEGKGRHIDEDSRSSVECGVCDGAGIIKNKNAGEVENILFAVPVLGTRLNYHYIKTVSAAVEAFGGEWYRRAAIAKSFTYPPVVLESDSGVQIAVMPMRP